MFTGIIEAVGKIEARSQEKGEWRLKFFTGDLDLSDVKIGDSIAVSGCCLTVVEKHATAFLADVSNETMRCTSLGTLEIGSAVNLEKAMLATDRFGGHIVSGHVDGVGHLIKVENEGQSIKMTFKIPSNLSKYVAAKGSICVDGTSLTVNEANDDYFAVNLIPHTQDETVSGSYQIGDSVNLEVDIIARYLERMNEGLNNKAHEITKGYLKENGFG
ncbi:MAG: riboflavin synthase [Gammaproteobacteria bacterium]|jgi:riboflavin synthase|nr:riboflavin synthase [Gammaproteobacteria bacterium]|tara:strand:- start:148 stop:795 length:648 start_codon:yes stop_codon:yes gene_type:complete